MPHLRILTSLAVAWLSMTVGAAGDEIGEHLAAYVRRAGVRIAGNVAGVFVFAKREAVVVHWGWGER